MCFSTNRLFRKIYKSLQFVAEEIIERGIRCIFVNSGVDTADTQSWEMLFHIHAMLDQFGVTLSADHVRAGQEGLFARHLVFGTISFGYRGVPIPGELTKRKRPRCRLEVDPLTAPIVLQIFTWYVRDRIPISEIVRRLNDQPEVPLPPRCTSGAWTYRAVHDLLRNARYRGYWEYGKTQLMWLSKKDYARQVPREKPLRAEQIEELRIIPDELWYAAQERLAQEDRSAVGRKPRDGDWQSRPRLLHGLFRCPAHDQILYVGGLNGRYLFCKVCKALSAEKRPLYSYLPRLLALRLTCRKLSSLLQADEELIGQVRAAAQERARLAQEPDPAQLEELRRKEKQHTEQIQFLLKNAGETEADRQESGESLRSHRRQRAEVQAAISRLTAAGNQPVEVPDEATIRGLLNKLDDVLAAAANGDLGDEKIGSAREVLEQLTGGCIHLFQQGERAAQRGWLQGRFKPRLLQYLLAKTTGCSNSNLPATETEVVIDYREATPIDQEAERAKQLYDQGLLNCQIAASMGCGRSRVTKLIQHWFTSRGLPVPDGRQRRSTLAKKQTNPPLYQQLSEEAKALWDAGLADIQIAARLGCSPPTAVAAVEHWHSSRGLTAPTHTERQAALIDQMLALYDQGLMIREIGRQVGMCSLSVTLLLRQRLEFLGRPMPDGRQRRASLNRKNCPIEVGGTPSSAKP